MGAHSESLPEKPQPNSRQPIRMLTAQAPLNGTKFWLAGVLKHPLQCCPRLRHVPARWLLLELVCSCATEGDTGYRLHSRLKFLVQILIGRASAKVKLRLASHDTTPHFLSSHECHRANWRQLMLWNTFEREDEKAEQPMPHRLG